MQKNVLGRSMLHRSAIIEEYTLSRQAALCLSKAAYWRCATCFCPLQDMQKNVLGNNTLRKPGSHFPQKIWPFACATCLCPLQDMQKNVLGNNRLHSDQVIRTRCRG